MTALLLTVILSVVSLLLPIGPALGGPALPQPPCGTPPFPQFAGIDDPPAVRVWQSAELPDAWTPPDCLGWTAKADSSVIAVAGRIRNVAQHEVMLRRLGSISAMRSIRYWSTTRQEWRTLYSESLALAGPDRSLAREDFTPAEATTGRDYYIWLREASPVSGMVYQIRFQQLSERRIVVAQVNVTSARFLGTTAMAAGDLEIVHFIEQEAGNVWRYYGLLRVARTTGPMRIITVRSLVNRLVATYRFLAGNGKDSNSPGPP